MRKLFTFIFTMSFAISFAQTPVDTSKKAGQQKTVDKVLGNASFSGYVQLQFDKYEGISGQRTGSPLFLNAPSSYSTAYVRAARLTFSYKVGLNTKFVLQSDFSTSSVTMKDAYAVVNIPWVKGLSIFAGQFLRPEYEVQTSNASLDVFERAAIVRKLYPGEREVGEKIEYNPTKIPLHIQFAVLNGNYTGTEAKDNDNDKDIMARAYYTLKIPTAKATIDFGGHCYFGNVSTAYSKYIQDSDYKVDSTSASSTSTPGRSMKKHWFAAEARVNFDILGGIALKGEYFMGQNAYAGAASTDPVTTSTTYKNYTVDTTTNIVPASKTTTNTYVDGMLSSTTVTTVNGGVTTKTTTQANIPNRIRQISGYYIYLIKNIGKKNQFIARYDLIDPNTKVKGDAVKYIKNSTDIQYKTLDLVWKYSFDENILIALQYEIPINEKNTLNPTNKIDNTFSVRIQARF